VPKSGGRTDGKTRKSAQRDVKKCKKEDNQTITADKWNKVCLGMEREKAPVFLQNEIFICLENRKVIAKNQPHFLASTSLFRNFAPCFETNITECLPNGNHKAAYS
jgi:hypothetical protein